jgi:hypothetical protein
LLGIPIRIEPHPLSLSNSFSHPAGKNARRVARTALPPSPRRFDGEKVPRQRRMRGLRWIDGLIESARPPKNPSPTSAKPPATSPRSKQRGGQASFSPSLRRGEGAEPAADEGSSMDQRPHRVCQTTKEPLTDLRKASGHLSPFKATGRGRTGAPPPIRYNPRYRPGRLRVTPKPGPEEPRP